MSVTDPEIIQCSFHNFDGNIHEARDYDVVRAPWREVITGLLLKTGGSDGVLR